MDDEPKPKHRPFREVKGKAIKAIGSIVNAGTKRRSASTHGRSGRAQKAPKLSHYKTSLDVDEDAENVSAPPPRTPSPHVNEGAEDVSMSLHRTPSTKRRASHASLVERENKIYATDMETQIAAEARGVTRKNIPWDKFHSTYLCDFSVEAQPQLTVDSVKKIGEGNWEEQLFWDRLRKVLSSEVRCSGCAFIRLSPLLTD